MQSRCQSQVHLAKKALAAKLLTYEMYSDVYAELRPLGTRRNTSAYPMRMLTSAARSLLYVRP